MQEKSTSLVSILVSAYNAEYFLLDTIQSILKQTYINFELLILDDKSKDDTFGLQTKISDPRVQWFKGEVSRGPYGGLNFLLDQAKGVYIAIQDHDDLWHPTKIEKQITFLESDVGKNYIGCGTKTLMRYESDQKGFLYYLGKENYYTIHPSLVFRNNESYRYPTGSIYMNDALFQKKVLCNGEKRIYNLDEALTLHVIKDGAKNFSYKRFTYTRETFRTIFALHPVWYGVFVVGRETMRKVVYPSLRLFGKGKWIDVMERKPFELLGNTMGEYGKERLREMGFLT